MTFFFLLIGLEIKFHLVEGEHKNKKTNITCSGSPWRCDNSCLNIHIF
nr:Na+/H+ antiporter NhaA [Rickettsia endosymbiont of Proechinophthirus fluctus]